MATIKGKWKWIGIVPSSGNEVWNYPINFSSNNMTFSSLKIEPYAIPIYALVFYDNYEVQSCAMNDPSDANGDGDYEVVATLREEYSIMDFGEVEQYIDDMLYTFILANATNITPSTMAEKLTKIVENQQKVYDAGYKAGEESILSWFLPTSQGIEVELTESIDSDGSELGEISSTVGDILFGPRYEYNDEHVLVPVLYNIYSAADADRNIDKYYYVGEAVIDDIQYDKWRKIEPAGDYNWTSSAQAYAYTAPVAK